MIWPKVQLQDVALKKKGAIVSGPFGSNISAKYFVEDGVPVIRGNNLTKGRTKFIDEGFAYLTEAKAAEFRNCIAVADDIVFTAAGSIGQVGLIPPDSRYEEYVISNKQLRVRLDKSKADPNFVYAWLSSPRIVRYLEGMNNGGAVPLLNLGIIRRVPVPLPPMEKQNRIADILSSYDSLIENNRRRIALLEAAARLLYREWFVHFRFPGRDYVKFIDGLPEGWETCKIGEMLSRIKRPGKIKKGDYLDKGPIPCIDQSGNYIGGYTDNEDARITSPLPLVVFGDHTRVFKFVDFPFACGADGTQLLFPKDDRLSIQYFYFAVSDTDLSNYFYARHFKFLKDQFILVPSPDIVSDFTEFSKDTLKQISVLREMNHSLSQARALLLPRLMNGEVKA